MLRHKRLEHRFVHHIPEVGDPGVIYISMEYATAVHKCCCGCGEEVVTPITPTDWKLTFDGESVSLSPSIGNWNMECQSHYFVQRNKVIDCKQWTRKRIEAGRRKDKARKAEYYESSVQPSVDLSTYHDPPGRSEGNASKD